MIYAVSKKLLILSILSITIFLSACSKLQVEQPPNAQACTQEAKICPDGSAVGRTGPNCEFSPCAQ
ncbi:MAG: hypothetical protein WAZ12_01775 [Candidatus Absconditicoccaceae bacterium]